MDSDSPESRGEERDEKWPIALVVGVLVGPVGGIIDADNLERALRGTAVVLRALLSAVAGSADGVTRERVAERVAHVEPHARLVDRYVARQAHAARDGGDGAVDHIPKLVVDFREHGFSGALVARDHLLEELAEHRGAGICLRCFR